MITQCCIHELYIRGKSHQPTVDFAKSFERRKCNHKEAIPGNECIVSVVGRYLLYSPITCPLIGFYALCYIPGETNKHRYVIATQSQPLRVSLRAIPGVPIVHINRSVMVLEPASDATLQFKQRVRYQFYRCHLFCTHTLTLQAEDDALGPSKSERAALNAVAPQVEAVVKRKKRPKGPNPLSVKKKAPKGTLAATTRVEKAEVGSKRKRQEGDNIAGASVEIQPKPKRRRSRHKAATRPPDAAK